MSNFKDNFFFNLGFLKKSDEHLRQLITERQQQVEPSQQQAQIVNLIYYNI
jgi:hypothetical protein